jgi:hypothetical protein
MATLKLSQPFAVSLLKTAVNRLLVGLPHNWFQLTAVVSPLLDDRLEGFQADFSLLLGASFADPDHVAALGAGRLFIEDKFDHLAAPWRLFDTTRFERRALRTGKLGILSPLV